MVSCWMKRTGYKPVRTIRLLHFLIRFFTKVAVTADSVGKSERMVAFGDLLMISADIFAGISDDNLGRVRAAADKAAVHLRNKLLDKSIITVLSDDEDDNRQPPMTPASCSTGPIPEVTPTPRSQGMGAKSRSSSSLSSAHTSASVSVAASASVVSQCSSTTLSLQSGAAVDSSLALVAVSARSESDGDVEAIWANLSRNELLDVACRLRQKTHQQESQLSATHGKLVLQRRANRSQATQLVSLKRSAASLMGQIATLSTELSIVKAGKAQDGRGGRLTLKSVFCVGIRKSLSNIATADFGRTICIDMSHQTVARCEIRTAAALIRSVWRFHSEVVQHFTTALSWGLHAEPEELPDNWTLFGYSIKADATSSSIWQRKKLHVLECRSCFVSNMEQLAHGNFTGAITEVYCTSDLQAVQDGSAQGSLAMVDKQLRALGVPTWSELIHDIETSVICDKRSVFLICDCTDAGSDQTKRRRLIHVSVLNYTTIIYLDSNCLIHQMHLIVKLVLGRLDDVIKQFGRPFKSYFASLAKTANVWRDNATAISAEWTKVHGPEFAKEGQSLMMHVVAGRWGSVDTAEDFLLQRTRARVLPVLRKIVGEKIKARKATINDSTADLSATPATSAEAGEPTTHRRGQLTIDDVDSKEKEAGKPIK